jgi:nicotinamidase-related amidase
MNKALLIVDYSNDFISDQGALSCGAIGQAVDTAIAEKIEAALAGDDFIFVCNDEHDKDDAYDPEALLFPPHNLAGSWGAEIYGKTGERIRKLLAGRHEKVVYLPKKRYSAFYGTPLDYMLRARNVRELTVVGVCTDICVLHTVIDAIYKGYTVKVPENCCATIIGHGQEWAINHMKNCLNVEII